MLCDLVSTNPREYYELCCEKCDRDESLHTTNQLNTLKYMKTLGSKLLRDNYWNFVRPRMGREIDGNADRRSGGD